MRSRQFSLYRCILPGENASHPDPDATYDDACSYNVTYIDDDGNAKHVSSPTCDLGYAYDPGGAIADSAVAEWDLVCEEGGARRATVGAAPMFGYIVGEKKK